MFTVFDRDALIEALKDQTKGFSRIGSNKTAGKNTNVDAMSVDEWDAILSDNVSKNSSGKTGDAQSSAITNSILEDNPTPNYADEIPPFDVTISFANEYGQKAVLVIYGLEILNEGTGYSIDSVTTEKACTFVARKVDYMKPVNADGSVGVKSNG